MLNKVTFSISVGGAPPAEGSGPQASAGPLSEELDSGPRRRKVLAPAERDALLAELLKLHYASVWRTLRRVGVEANRVEDAAQEVFIVAARKLEQIEPGRERSYLLSSATRIAANYRRAGKARREVLDDRLLEDHRDPVPDAGELVHRKRLRQLLDDVLGAWPSEIRTAFVMFELEGLSVPEIAELTETKVGTVASRLRRARELFFVAVKRLKARGVLEGGSP